MMSKESQVVAQVRLSQWEMEIQECQNRPRNITVNQWCEQRGITKANYYRRIKRVRQACLEQLETSSDSKYTGFEKSVKKEEEAFCAFCGM